ncbi:GDSL-type esterase/lipase family protein [Pinibacter soli]|uniref:GDSL-type esterase/lipase family protein n=1 Tax=Pinibacter soli TaxID=3044211 RepID=A0ABT6R9V4_9BACT|nr:GDSL-type esterase/lipase family protein [Pinibacter soli]MDI3319261.1 GDSL-type esterase/lipase family protein [Pinibacter soli]
MLGKRFFVTLLLSLICNFIFSQQPIKVACLGNSVTYGYLHKEPSKTSYPVQLQQLLGAGYLVRNFGHSGATLLRHGHNPYSKTKEFANAINFRPDIAIIDLGLNDTDPRNWPNYRDEFLPDYSWLIDTLRKSNPAVKIFICKMTPIFSDHPIFKSGTRDWFWQIQNLIPQIATVNKTGLIDFHSPLYSRPDLFPDALHPNEAGALILANTVYQKLSGNFGGFKLAPVFESHMVLQRNKAIHFYGTANVNEKIVVSFNGKKETCTASEDGKWDAKFPAMQAGGPYTATFISSSGSVTLEDILVGEVWLCSGQSNMYFRVRDAIMDKNEMSAAEKNSTLRLLRMQPFAETDNNAWDQPVLQKVNELSYFSGTWQHCDSTAVKYFSAVAYFYGKKLQSELKVPIGLIQVAVGGSTTESWIDRYTMEHDPVLVNELTNWRKSDFFQPWVRERADTNLSKSDNPKQRHPYEPCYNFEAGIKTFIGFPIAGVIWYQGESNAHNIELHEAVFPALVKSWRSQWGYDFPFYYVQLSSINRPSWPSFRYSQLQMLKVIPNTGMAVTSDLGDSLNVHYPLKAPVGERLANLALNFYYGRKDVVPYGPLPVKAVRENDHIIVSFKYADHLQTRKKEPLKGFKILDEFGRPVPSEAFINANEVVIHIDPKATPKTVLYAWEPFTDANLENGAALPASTFKLDIN